ncbi:zinc-ribbon domain-containing protein [Clostridium minihomine]|uniref:zinc-ribbon domain-containing protein n=1 Tax=Clostridium minihomine TaxID=2045012 RepID=UPI000C769B7F|nr:zinc-ribbon domain-containing protein [Clostridium minihomine]
MFCNKCGNQISDDSKFCFHCGQKVESNPSAGFADAPPEAYVPPATNFTPEPAAPITPPEEEEEEKEGCAGQIFMWLMGALLFFCVVFSLTGRNGDSPETITAGTVVSSASPASSAPAVSSAPALTPMQKQIKQIFEEMALANIEQSVKEQLKNPDTAKFTHDQTSWKGKNAIYTGSGTVNYTSANGGAAQSPFSVSILLGEKSYYVLYLKLGDTVSVNCLNGVNSLGIITKAGEDMFGKGSGLFIFDTSEDGYAVLLRDPDSEVVTMEEYNQIKDGMEYAQVSEIIGSYGTELGRSTVAGYETAMIFWDGNGGIASGATITFSNGKVFAKSQIGLE